MDSDLHVDKKEASVHPVEFTVEQVDRAAELVAGDVSVLNPVEADRLRRKIDKHLLPMMCILYLVQYIDKSTLSNAAVLGIRDHLTVNQYNWLGTIFYLTYLVFEFPQNLCLQRFPVGKWLSINVFVWAIALCCHAASKTFGGLMACRFILGACEGSVTAGFLLSSAVFYTRNEQTVRVGSWFFMNGIAQVISGFVSFGVLHIKTERFEPWQWLMIITGIVTLIVAVAFWFFFPDSPTNAWFLTLEERKMTIQRIKENQTGIENKHLKKEQMIEALTDPKTWMFALLSALTNVCNSISNQRSIIINSFGFSSVQTTLLSMGTGGMEILTIIIATNIAARVPNSRGYVAAIWDMLNLPGMFLVLFLSWKNQTGLLVSLYFVGVGTSAFVIALSWMSQTTAGHTKKITTNTVMLCAYCIGNAAGPFLWKAQYKPRNHVPLTVMIVCNCANVVILLAIRWYLKHRNQLRDAEPEDTTFDDAYIEKTSDEGFLEKVKVDKAFLDLTDKQNRDFRYVL